MDQRARLGTAVGEAGELQQLAESDHLTDDRDVAGRRAHAATALPRRRRPSEISLGDVGRKREPQRACVRVLGEERIAGNEGDVVLERCPEKLVRIPAGVAVAPRRTSRRRAG